MADLPCSTAESNFVGHSRSPTAVSVFVASFLPLISAVWIVVLLVLAAAGVGWFMGLLT